MPRMVVDIDSHIVEPPDLWEKNLGPRYRARALRLKEDAEGVEYMEVDGKKPKNWFLSAGTFGRMGAIGKDLNPVVLRGGSRYQDAMIPGAIDPHARIKVLDRDGIDLSLLYPTVGLSWESECQDSGLATAYTRVYNDWIAGFCKPYPKRLIPVAHVSLLDVLDGAKELHRSVKQGSRGAYISARPLKNLPYSDPSYDPFWAAAQELDVPISLHVIGDPIYSGSQMFSPDKPESPWWIFVTTVADMFLGFTSLFEKALFDRFPGLKIVILESGCGWLGYWLDRMDSKFALMGFTTPMKLKPSDYFRRHCWVSMDPDEPLGIPVAKMIGADRILWAADYPHSDGHVSPLKELEETISQLPEPDRRKILGENAVKLYRLS